MENQCLKRGGILYVADIVIAFVMQWYAKHFPFVTKLAHFFKLLVE